MKQLFNNYLIRMHNAKTIRSQIQRGEWELKLNNISNKHLTAHRDGLELWVSYSNGPFFLEIEGEHPNMIGYFWRHWLWWTCVRGWVRQADKNIPNKTPRVL